MTTDSRVTEGVINGVMNDSASGWREGVIEDFLSHSSRFSYEQTVRLLHWHGVDKPRTRAHLSLGFPATDVVALQYRRAQDQAPQATITTHLLGLYGTSSPLPTFYTEELLDEAADDNCVMRDFCDLLNQPLYDQHFQAWTKYQPMLRLVERQDETLTECLYALLGLGGQGLPQATRLYADQLPHIGLLTQLTRSVLGLETLLAQIIGCQVEVEPFVACWATIPPEQQCRLGIQGHQVGEVCYLGTQFLDRNNTVRLHIRISQTDIFNELLPGQARYLKIEQFLSSYLFDPLDVQLWLWPDLHIVQPAILQGQSPLFLGINSWLGDIDPGSDTPLMIQLPMVGVH